MYLYEHVVDTNTSFNTMGRKALVINWQPTRADLKLSTEWYFAENMTASESSYKCQQFENHQSKIHDSIVTLHRHNQHHALSILTIDHTNSLHRPLESI